MDLVALALAKKYANSRIANFGGADWAQNASGAKDYVKNRTHYEEKAILFDGTIPEDAIPFPVIEGGCFVKIQDMPLSYDELLNKEYCLLFVSDEGNIESLGVLTEGALAQEDNLFIYGMNNDGIPILMSAYEDFDLPLDEDIVLSMTKGLYFFAADMGVQKMYLSRLGKDGVKQLDAKYIPDLPQYALKPKEYKLIYEKELTEESAYIGGSELGQFNKMVIFITIPASEEATNNYYFRLYKNHKFLKSNSLPFSNQYNTYVKITALNNDGIADITYSYIINNTQGVSTPHIHTYIDYIEGNTPFTGINLQRISDINMAIGTKISVWGVEA